MAEQGEKSPVQCTPTRDFETHNTNARPRTATIETNDTFAPGNCTKIARFSPAKVMAVSIPRMHAQAKAMAVSDERAVCRAEPLASHKTWAWLRHPWAAAGPGRATSGRPTLQTSSNHHDLNRLARTSVTNVVNMSPKTSIFTEKAVGLTTFVTTGQKSTRKTPWIDDVCNNTRRATCQHTRPHWCGGRRRDRRAWLRCPWAAAGPGQATHRHPDRLEAAARPAGPGRASSRRAKRSSRRGRRAGGQASRRPEICRATNNTKPPGPTGGRAAHASGR